MTPRVVNIYAGLFVLRIYQAIAQKILYSKVRVGIDALLVKESVYRRLTIVAMQTDE